MMWPRNLFQVVSIREFLLLRSFRLWPKDCFVLLRPIIQICGSCSCLSGYSTDHLQMSSQLYSRVIRLAGQHHDSESCASPHGPSLAFIFFPIVRDDFLIGILRCIHKKNSFSGPHWLCPEASPGQLCHLDQCLCWGWSYGVGTDQPAEIRDSTGYPHY